MNVLLTSTGLIALAEMGDKTQLLAFLLAARFRKPTPIIFGILVATLLNHGIAGAVGAWVGAWLTPQMLRWSVGLLFFGMAVWTMIPDKIEAEEAQVATRLGVFGATLAMAAHYPTPVLVVAGTTLGMLIADVPAVFIGDRLAGRIPMKLVHTVAALLFALLGVATLTGLGKKFGL